MPTMTKAVERSPGSSRREASPGIQAAAFLAPGMAGFAIFIIAPLIGSLVISLYDWPLFGEARFVGGANYVRMFAQDPLFWGVLRNTFLFAVFYTLANLVIAILLAQWLNTLGRLGGFFRVIFFIPVVTPMVGNALVWKLLLADNGFVNSILGIVGVAPVGWLRSPGLSMFSLICMSLWAGIGYNIIVLGAGLSSVNPSVIEASMIDGASAIQRFTRITLPLLTPSIFFCTVMTLIGAFKVFAQPFNLTLGGPGTSTTTIVQYLYQNGFSYDRLGYASSLAWVLFVVVMLFTALQFSQQKRVNYDA